MPMFGGKHYSNPAVGKAHEGMGMEGEGEKEHSEPAKSYHVFQHEDGTAHSHIHHADDSHEHTDHASHEEAHDHVGKAMGEEAGESPEFEANEDEKTEKPMTMHNAARMSGGAF